MIEMLQDILADIIVSRDAKRARRIHQSLARGGRGECCAPDARAAHVQEKWVQQAINTSPPERRGIPATCSSKIKWHCAQVHPSPNFGDAVGYFGSRQREDLLMDTVRRLLMASAAQPIWRSTKSGSNMSSATHLP